MPLVARRIHRCRLHSWWTHRCIDRVARIQVHTIYTWKRECKSIRDTASRGSPPSALQFAACSTGPWLDGSTVTIEIRMRSPRNKCDSDTENADCRRFERAGGAYGRFRARFGTILDDRFSFSLLFPSLYSFQLYPLPFLASVGQPCALKSAISAGTIPDIWFRGRPISCVYGNLSPAFPSLLDFIPILFQLDALKTFRTLSRLYTGAR